MTEDTHSNLILAATELRKLVRRLDETLLCAERSSWLTGCKISMRQAKELAMDIRMGVENALREAQEEEPR